jgi:hypothetical protein
MTKKTWFELDSAWFELESHTGEVLVRANRRRFFAKRSDGHSVLEFRTEKQAKSCAKALFASDRTDLPKFIVVVRFEVALNRTAPCMFRNPKAPPAKKRAA